MPYSILKCPVCGSEYQIERNSYVCDRCGNILDVIQKDIANFKKTSMKGVWRYKEIVHPVLNNNQIITKWRVIQIFITIRNYPNTRELKIFI